MSLFVVPSFYWATSFLRSVAMVPINSIFPTTFSQSNKWLMYNTGWLSYWHFYWLYKLNKAASSYGLPWWLREKRICLQWGRPRFDPWVGKIPWRRERQLTPVLLLGKFHGWRNLLGYSPWGCKESDMTERLHFHFSLSLFTFMRRRRKWQPTPIFLPGEFHGQRSLMSYSSRGRKE